MINLPNEENEEYVEAAHYTSNNIYLMNNSSVFF